MEKVTNLSRKGGLYKIQEVAEMPKGNITTFQKAISTTASRHLPQNLVKMITENQCHSLSTAQRFYEGHCSAEPGATGFMFIKLMRVSCLSFVIPTGIFVNNSIFVYNINSDFSIADAGNTK